MSSPALAFDYYTEVIFPVSIYPLPPMGSGGANHEGQQVNTNYENKLEYIFRVI